VQTSKPVEIVVPCPSELFHRLEGLASLGDVSISELVIEALQKELSSE
jgi:hypothetical protein